MSDRCHFGSTAGPVWQVKKLQKEGHSVAMVALGEVTQTKDGHSKNLTCTRNISIKCNKQVTSKQQIRFSLTSIN
jgi:hypothetical protein